MRHWCLSVAGKWTALAKVTSPKKGRATWCVTPQVVLWSGRREMALPASLGRSASCPARCRKASFLYRNDLRLRGTRMFKDGVEAISSQAGAINRQDLD